MDVKKALMYVTAVIGGIGAAVLSVSGGSLGTVQNDTCQAYPDTYNGRRMKEMDTKKEVLLAMLKTIESDSNMTAVEKSRQLDSIKIELNLL